MRHGQYKVDRMTMTMRRVQRGKNCGWSRVRAAAALMFEKLQTSMLSENSSNSDIEHVTPQRHNPRLKTQGRC